MTIRWIRPRKPLRGASTGCRVPRVHEAPMRAQERSAPGLKIRLGAPEGISHVQGRSGGQYVVRDRVIEAEAEDAPRLPRRVPGKPIANPSALNSTSACAAANRSHPSRTGVSIAVAGKRPRKHKNRHRRQGADFGPERHRQPAKRPKFAVPDNNPAPKGRKPSAAKTSLKSIGRWWRTQSRRTGLRSLSSLVTGRKTGRCFKIGLWGAFRSKTLSFSWA
jgi:hypothetical protein